MKAAEDEGLLLDEEMLRSQWGQYRMRRRVTSITSGVEYEFKNGFTLGFHSTIGLSNLFEVVESSTDSDIKEITDKLKFKMRSAAITIGYNFAKLLD